MANWEKKEYANIKKGHVFSFSKMHNRTETGRLTRIGPLYHSTYSPTPRMQNMSNEAFYEKYNEDCPPLQIQKGYEQFRDDPMNNSENWRKNNKAVQREIKTTNPVVLKEAEMRQKEDKSKRLTNTVSGPYLCTVYETMENCNVRKEKTKDQDDDKAKQKKKEQKKKEQKKKDNTENVLTPMAFNYIYFATFMRHRLKEKNDEQLPNDLDFMVRYKSDTYFDVKLGMQATTNYNMQTIKWDDNRTLALAHILATCAVTATCCDKSFSLMNTMLSSFIYDEKFYTVDRNQLKLKVGEYRLRM